LLYLYLRGYATLKEGYGVEVTSYLGTR